MRPAEAGLLMLTCPLGQADVPLLTPYQFARAARLVRARHRDGEDPEAALTEAVLEALGFTMENSARIVALLTREQTLADYLARGDALGVTVLTSLSPGYPAALRKLHGDAPTALFCRGDLSLLGTRCIALVGSRRIDAPARRFAERIGMLAAREGYTLVSGGASGADSAAQAACLANGGNVIVCTPQRLEDAAVRPRMLFLSESGYDLPFSAHRALSRNRLIHAMGERTFVARCESGRGGTWHGSTENLRGKLSPLFIFNDGSDGAAALIAMGATPVTEIASIGGCAPQHAGK